VKQAETLVAYPTTRLFTTLFDEFVEEAERILRLANILRTANRSDEAYYDAMAEVYVTLSHLEMHVPDMRKEMDHLDGLFPDENERSVTRLADEAICPTSE
jgi:hypothetical protein